MDQIEALQLCRLAKSVSPAQAIDEYTPQVWHEVLIDIRYVDAHQALIELAREQTWMHVSDIVKRVKHIRRERVINYGVLPIPPAEFDDDHAGGMAWSRDLIRRIGDGEVVERPAIGQRGSYPGHGVIDEIV